MITLGQITAAALWIAEYEGPYHFDPRDPGRETAYGISIRYNPQFTRAQLQAMTPQIAAEFFAKKYWLEEWNALPPCLATPMMAFAVLEGTTEAARALQGALVVKVDGFVGAQTAAAANSVAPKTLLVEFFRYCRRRLAESADWSLDGEGWECRQVSASLAAGVAP